MQESPIPYYVVEFLSEEWITWSTFSLIFIATPLVFAKYLNASQKKYLLYIMSVLLIIEYTGENLKNRVLEKMMSLSEWISSNESLLSGIAAVVVIFGFIAAISRSFLTNMRKGGGKLTNVQKITLSELSSPSPYPIQFADSDGVKLDFNTL